MTNNDFSSDNLPRYEGHYNEDDFWKKVAKVARKAGVKTVYYAIVLYETLADSATPAKYRAVIAGALGYFILPIDLIPDFLPAFGLTDDWGALLAAIFYVSKAVTPQIKERARGRLTSWFGSVAEEDLGDLK